MKKKLQASEVPANPLSILSVFFPEAVIYLHANLPADTPTSFPFQIPTSGEPIKSKLCQALIKIRKEVEVSTSGVPNKGFIEYVVPYSFSITTDLKVTKLNVKKLIELPVPYAEGEILEVKTLLEMELPSADKLMKQETTSHE